jgi:hypothetical protein
VESEEPDSPTMRAINMMMDGRVEEANVEFDRLAQSATDVNEQIHINVVRVLFHPKKKRFDVIEALDRLEAPLKETAQYSFHAGVYETRSAVSIAHLRRALTLGVNPYLLGSAYGELAKRLAQSLRTAEDTRPLGGGSLQRALTGKKTNRGGRWAVCVTRRGRRPNSKRASRGCGSPAPCVCRNAATLCCL